MGPAMQRNTISGGARKKEKREREDRIDRGGAKLRKEGGEDGKKWGESVSFATGYNGQFSGQRFSASLSPWSQSSEEHTCP